MKLFSNFVLLITDYFNNDSANEEINNIIWKRFGINVHFTREIYKLFLKIKFISECHTTIPIQEFSKLKPRSEDQD